MDCVLTQKLGKNIHQIQQVSQGENKQPDLDWVAQSVGLQYGIQRVPGSSPNQAANFSHPVTQVQDE
jgi:hypothetical protein